MNEDVIIPWLLQHSTIWTAVLAALAPAMIASFKRRSVMRWYLYGFACTLVAWPLITLPTVHAFLMRPRTMSPEARQRQRRADALALLAESGVQSYPTWIAELRRKSPEGVDRRRYVYKEIGPGDSMELIRELADHRDKHTVAFRHRGVNIGYVPKRHQWVAHAIDDGRRLVAIVDKVRVGGIFRRRAKYVRVRIAVLNPR
jgi:HIRAN domain